MLKSFFFVCIVYTLSFVHGHVHDSIILSNDHHFMRDNLDLTNEHFSDIFESDQHGNVGTVRSSPAKSENHNPSYNLQKHSLHYEPHGYKMIQYALTSKKHVVSFTYQVNDSIYESYIFRVRYHGHHDYATDLRPINKNESGVNQLIMNDFNDNTYIVCVALFANNMTDAEPLSTSGMCLDVLIGEEVSREEHESLTGLLSPLLLAVAALFLIFISVFDFSMKRVRSYKKKKEGANDEINAKDDVKSIHSTIHLGAQMNRNDLSKIFHQAERRGSIWDERVTGRLVRASESDVSFENAAYAYDDSDEPDQNKSSLDTLSHLLDSKPWLSTKRPSIIEEEPAPPSFYLKDN